MGANGAGKSTLMNMLGGVVGMDEGEILIDGAAGRRCDRRSTRSSTASPSCTRS